MLMPSFEAELQMKYQNFGAGSGTSSSYLWGTRF
jgi:hypothetical protein